MDLAKILVSIFKRQNHKLAEIIHEKTPLLISGNFTKVLYADDDTKTLILQDIQEYFSYKDKQIFREIPSRLKTYDMEWLKNVPKEEENKLIDDYSKYIYQKQDIQF